MRPSKNYKIGNNNEELNLRSDLVEGQFGIQNQGHMREEIEISLLTLNGNKFIGTITPQEAKFNIYWDVLKFGDFLTSTKRQRLQLMTINN